MPISISAETIYCSCILTARALGVPIPANTNAGELKPNSYPAINGLILFKYDEYYHASKIIGFQEDGILVIEGNFKRCEITERIISFSDPALRGFWYPTL